MMTMAVAGPDSRPPVEVQHQHQHQPLAQPQPQAQSQPAKDDSIEKLSTNVMNYLVWRYLQESGYGKTAKQLQYQWMGRDQSPEQLPFAHNIKKSCLIHMAQDGLLLDHLQAEVKKINRQYVFGTDHGGKFSVPAEEPREKKTRIRSTSRMPSGHDRDLHNGSPAEPPPRRGKGKRKSGGGAEKRVNGDAMDIDGGLNAATATDATAGDAESPLPVIEELPPISTLDIGESKGTITETPRDLTANTSFVGLDPGVLLEQVTWSPHNRNALVTAGRNYMRVFKVSNNATTNGADGTAIPNDVHTRSTVVDLGAQSDAYSVDAFTWTERGSGALTTRETIHNEDGDAMLTYRLLGFTDFGSKVCLVDSTAGWVLALKYNSPAGLLLALSWGEQSHVKVWRYDETVYENAKRRIEPRYSFKCAKTMDAMVLAVEWMGPDRFVVAGQRTLQIYGIDDEGIHLLKSADTDFNWLHLKYDPVYGIAAVLDDSQQTVGLVRTDVEGELQLQTHNVDFKINDLAFQPLDAKPTVEEGQVSQQQEQRILAAATDMGHVHLYNALIPVPTNNDTANTTDSSAPATTNASTTPAAALQRLQTLTMTHEAIPQVLAFSPDGFLLAAAGYDTLDVWKTPSTFSSLGSSTTPSGVWHIPPGADDRWKSEDTDGDTALGENGDAGEDSSVDRFVHKLGWDADGKRVAFGMNGQVAVVRL